jgi:hypothetical protein
MDSRVGAAGAGTPVNLALFWMIEFGFEARHMDTPLRLLIRSKLADGRLPLNSIPRMWGGPADGESCDACEEVVTTAEFIMEGIAVTPTQAPVQFHVECFYLWDEERRKVEPPHSSPGRAIRATARGD